MQDTWRSNKVLFERSLSAELSIFAITAHDSWRSEWNSIGNLFVSKLGECSIGMQDTWRSNKVLFQRSLEAELRIFTVLANNSRRPSYSNIVSFSVSELYLPSIWEQYTRRSNKRSWSCSLEAELGIFTVLAYNSRRPSYSNVVSFSLSELYLPSIREQYARRSNKRSSSADGDGYAWRSSSRE